MNTNPMNDDTMRPGLEPMLRAYIECALWTSHDESDESGGEPMDANYDASDIAPESLAQMRTDCNGFMSYCDEAIGDEWHAGQSFEQIGHDFWLTRNGHGTGFWDRGLGKLGMQLTDAAKTFGSCDLYVGDDGRIYAS